MSSFEVHTMKNLFCNFVKKVSHALSMWLSNQIKWIISKSDLKIWKKNLLVSYEYLWILKGIIRNGIFLGNTKDIFEACLSFEILFLIKITVFQFSIPPSPENSKTHISIPDIVALLSKKAGIVKNNDQTWHQANKAYLWNKALQSKQYM